MLHELEKALILLRQTKPLVLCLTNHVTMDFMANSLLSLGAAPIMSNDLRELDELVRISHAININIGTLDVEFISRANAAIILAKKYNKPIILDPVGAGATQIRTASSRSLMQAADIIRGNASEIMALIDDINETLGVESSHLVSDATERAKKLAKENSSIVVVSGVEDFITDGTREKYLGFGSALMPLVTGMGCTLTAVIAAFKAVIPDSYGAACMATAYYGLCGNLAHEKVNKPGAFRTAFIDELYAADFDSMRNLQNAS